MTVPYDVYTPEGRHAAAAAGANTLGTSPDSGFVTSEQYNAALEQVQQFINNANAYDREKFVAQYKDLAAARDNAVKLERMRDQTSRYGIDKQAETELKRLTENARQFDQTHALDLQRFGLDQQKFGLDQQKFGLQYANDVAAYESSPDKYAMGADFINAAGRAVKGFGQQPYGTGTTFTAKTPEDFARLAGYPGTPPAQSGGAGGPTGSSGVGNGASTDAGAAAPPDPRIAAVKKMFDAIPPSETPGMDPGDWAVMKAAQALYSSPLRSGTYDRLSPGNKAILGSYVQKSGRYLPDYIAQQTREQIGQGSVRAA